MFKTWRLPLLTALFTFIFYGTLELTLFPAGQQFVKYSQAATQYLAQTLPPERLLDFSPFYLYLHVAQLALFSAGGGMILYLQIFAVACSAALLLLLLHRFVSKPLALLGVAAFILSPALMVYSCILEPDAFLVAFLMAFLYFVTQKGGKNWFIAGLFLALALAIRPSVLPLLVFVPLYFCSNLERKDWRTASILVLAPVLCMLLAIGVRNGRVTGSYSPLGMNPGFVFYEGNNPLSTGKSAVYPPIVGELKNELGDQPDNPHMTYRLIAERASGQKLTGTAANRYWRQKGINFIVDHPGHFAASLISKGYIILHSFQRHDLFPSYAYAQRLQAAAIPKLPFAILVVFALGGMVLARHDWRRLLLFYALLGSQISIMLLFYVSERQKLVLLPCLIFFAVVAVQHFLVQNRRKQMKIGLGVLALAVFFSWPSNMMREEEHLWAGYALSDQGWLQAMRLREAGDFSGAVQAAASGYGAAPWLQDYARPEVLPFDRPDFAGAALSLLDTEDGTPSQQFDRAQLLIAAGKLDAAEVILQRLQGVGMRFDRVYLQSSQPTYYLAEIAWLRGDAGRAITLLEAGLKAAPGDPFILARLGALTGNEEYQQQLNRYYSEIDASFLLGMAQLEVGRGAEAAMNLTVANRLLPELRRVKIYLAAALGTQGEKASAAQLFLEATAEQREPVLLEGEIVPIFAALALAGDPQSLYRYGLVLAQYGRLAEARHTLRAATVISASPEIARALTEVEGISRVAQR